LGLIVAPDGRDFSFGFPSSPSRLRGTKNAAEMRDVSREGREGGEGETRGDFPREFRRREIVAFWFIRAGSETGAPSECAFAHFAPWRLCLPLSFEL
jgi:hypothetical protein